MDSPFHRLKGPVDSHAGYVYHATNSERAYDIASQGITTHRPHEFTDQHSWPDGSREKRNYFTSTAEHTWQFAPEEGHGVLLRVKRDSHPFKRENTGDIYSTATVHPKHIEYLHKSGGWKPLAGASMESQSRELVRSLVDARLATMDEFNFPSGSIQTRIKAFDSNHPAFHSAASKAFHTVQDHHKEILAHAVNASLYHVAGIDYPTETAALIHSKVMNLSNDLSVTSGMAHQMMTHAVTKLKAWRASQKPKSDWKFGTLPSHESKGDELDELLDRLHSVLKHLEPRYKDK